MTRNQQPAERGGLLARIMHALLPKKCEHLRVRETRSCDAICRDCGENLGFIQDWRNTTGRRIDSHEISN